MVRAGSSAHTGRVLLGLRRVSASVRFPFRQPAMHRSCASHPAALLRLLFPSLPCSCTGYSGPPSWSLTASPPSRRCGQQASSSSSPTWQLFSPSSGATASSPCSRTAPSHACLLSGGTDGSCVTSSGWERRTAAPSTRARLPNRPRLLLHRRFLPRFAYLFSRVRVPPYANIEQEERWASTRGLPRRR